MANSKKYIDILGPDYLGGPYPDFDSSAINEKCFAHSMRFKDVHFTTNGMIWTTQEHWTPSEFEDFKKEVIRAYRSYGKYKGKPICVTVEVRDGDEEEYFEFLG